MEWKTMSNEEQVLGKSLMTMFAMAHYPAQRIPDYLRAIADQMARDLQASADSGDKPCTCLACQSERAARAASNN